MSVKEGIKSYKKKILLLSIVMFVSLSLLVILLIGKFEGNFITTIITYLRYGLFGFAAISSLLIVFYNMRVNSLKLKDKSKKDSI